MLLKLEGDHTEKLEWTQQHVPVSVSVCSNVTGFTEPICFVDADMDQLLKKLVQSLTEIQETTAGKKWGKHLEILKTRLESLNKEDEDDRKLAEKIQSLYGQFKGYITTLPVPGFNR